MADYTRLAATATRLIKSNGRLVTLRKSPAISDSSKPWRAGTGSPDTVQTVGVMVPFDESTAEGQDVLRGDLTCYIDGVLPNPTDYVDLVDSKDDSVWKIIKASTIDPASTCVMSILTLKR